MDDKEAIELTNQAFRFGLLMRDAIIDHDSEGRKNVRAEWGTFYKENSGNHAVLFLAYRRGLETVPEDCITE
jgi:hypothetical protein